ncbi:MAG: HAD hydrolase family protein [Thermodesulfovibrionales bacterium]
MREIDAQLIKRAERIKLMVTDVDGVLTNTTVYYTPDGDYMRGFSVRDGMGVERLRNKANIETVIISGERSASILKRAEKLGIRCCYLGIDNKLSTLQTITSQKGLQMYEVAYIGDDLNDMDVIGAVGLSACPSDAYESLLSEVHIVCEKKGGEGAFREFAEFIIKSKGLKLEKED